MSVTPTSDRTRGRVVWLLGRLRRSTLARSVGTLGAAEVIVLGAAAVQAVVVARLLGPREFGVAALVVSFPALVFTFLDPRSSQAVVKYVAEFRSRGDDRGAAAVSKMAFVTDAALGGVGLLAVVAAAPWAARNVANDGGAGGLMIVYGAALTVAAPAATARAVLTTFERFSVLAVVQGIAAVLRLGLVVVLVAAGFGIEGFVWGSAIALLSEGAITAWAGRRELRRRLGDEWDAGRIRHVGDKLREILRFMAYTDLYSLVAVFVKQADIVILGALADGPGAAGHYRLARSVTAPVGALVAPLQAVVYPRLARLAALRDEAALAATATRYFVAIGLPLSALLLAVIPVLSPVITLVAGSDYLPAVVPAQILVAASAASVAFFWLPPTFNAIGRVRFLFVNGTAGALLSVAGYVALAPTMGATGIALVRGVVAGFAANLVGGAYLAVKRSRRALLG